jgi:hypothetical protein
MKTRPKKPARQASLETLKETEARLDEMLRAKKEETVLENVIEAMIKDRTTSMQIKVSLPLSQWQALFKAGWDSITHEWRGGTNLRFITPTDGPRGALGRAVSHALREMIYNGGLELIGKDRAEALTRTATE